MLTPLNFEFEEKQVRFVGTADKPEWIAQDVCDVLGIVDVSNALKDFRESEAGTHIIRTSGQSREMLTVTEPGLYRLIFKSRKPVAERFRCWIFDEVLPSIRKTGSYSLTQDVYAIQPWSQFEAGLVRLTETINNGFKNTATDIQVIKESVNVIDIRLRKLESKGRRDFSPTVKAIFMRVIWHHFKGRCPVSGVQIMDDEYSLIKVNGRPVAEFDHWNSSNNSRHTNGWLIDAVVHSKITDQPEFRYSPEVEDAYKSFKHHMKQMLELEQGIQQSLPI